jgi:hypothetical protein
MNKVIVAFIAGGLLISGPLVAQDSKPVPQSTGAEKSANTPPSTQKSMQQPKANETVLGAKTKGGGSMPDGTREQQRRIEDDYKSARKECDKLKAAEERSCNKQARDARSKARADLRESQKQANADAKAAKGDRANARSGPGADAKADVKK